MNTSDSTFDNSEVCLNLQSSLVGLVWFPKVVFNIKYVFLIIWLVMKNKLIDKQKKIGYTNVCSVPILKCHLKIDVSKTYDRVNWNFLKAVLSVMKFDSKWINWIMECVSSVLYTLLVNGNLTTPFIPVQGLRPGALCPLIFFLCVQTSFPFPFSKQKV